MRKGLFSPFGGRIAFCLQAAICFCLLIRRDEPGGNFIFLKFFEIFSDFGHLAAKSVRLGVAHPHDDALREIAEFFAEQVDAADVRRVRVNTDAQGDVFQRVELQIRDGDA